MFNLGETNLEDIPDGFPVGTTTHPMTVSKVEVVIPSNPKEEPTELLDYRRNLKITFEVSDPESEFFELTANATIVTYEFPEDSDVFESLSSASKARIKRFLGFYRQRMRYFGFSDLEINNNEIGPDNLQGIDMQVTISRANDDGWAQVKGYKRAESVIES